MTPTGITDVPRGAKALWTIAETHGWTVTATRATGTPLDTAGRPQTVKERVETGELTDAGRPRIEVVDTGRPLLVESTLLRLHRGTTRLWATWEAGQFRTAVRRSPFNTLTATALKELLTTPADLETP